MKRLLLLLLVVTSVAWARKDPIAEKRGEAKSATHSIMSMPGLSRATAAIWDSLAVDVSDIECDEVFVMPGGVIWIGGYVLSTNDDIVLRSTNSGATWTTITLSFTLTNGYALAVRDANTAIAATWIGDIYRTTNGGAKWDSVYNYGGGNGYFDGIKFSGGDSVMAVGDADGSGLCVVKSTNAGATWTRFTNLPAAEQATNVISSSGYHQMMDAIGPKVWISTYVKSGVAPRLLRTTDFGTSWTSADVLLTGGLTNAYRIRTINMVDANVGWLTPYQTASGVRSFVHKTTDGGTTWSDTILIARGAVVKAIKPMRGTNNLLGVGYTGNNTNAWWSTNAGVSWTDISPAATEDGSDLQNTWFVSNSLGYAVGVMKALKFNAPTTAVEPLPSGVPESYALSQNYPNPFNPTTTIEFSLPRAGNVELKVYDLLGREVATLAEGMHNAASYSVVFDARNLSSGIYFYRLRSGDFVSTRSLVLMK